MFAGGAGELVHDVMATANVAMADALEAADLAALPVRDRLRLGVQARLAVFAPHAASGTWAQALAVAALPHNAPTTLRLAAVAADELWWHAGDRSTDSVTWYSRRLLLMGVAASTEAFMLTDRSPGHAATWEFLDARLGDVAVLGRAAGEGLAVGGAVLGGLGSLADAGCDLLLRPLAAAVCGGGCGLPARGGGGGGAGGGGHEAAGDPAAATPIDGGAPSGAPLPASLDAVLRSVGASLASAVAAATTAAAGATAASGGATTVAASGGGSAAASAAAGAASTLLSGIVAAAAAAVASAGTPPPTSPSAPHHPSPPPPFAPPASLLAALPSLALLAPVADALAQVSGGAIMRALPAPPGGGGGGGGWGGGATGGLAVPPGWEGIGSAPPLPPGVPAGAVYTPAAELR